MAFEEWRPVVGYGGYEVSNLGRDEAAQIKRLLANGVGQYEIARQFGVSRGCVQMILLNRNWKTVEMAS